MAYKKLTQEEKELRLKIINEYYLSNKKTRSEVAKMLGLKTKGFIKFLYRNNIIKYEKALYRDRDWLYKEYVIEKKTARQIAEENNINFTVIYPWLRKFNIPVRETKESVFLNKKFNCNLTEEAEEFLSGELLGDGCLVTNCNETAYYQHGSSKRDYIIWLEKQLNKYGIEKIGRIRENKRKSGGNPLHSITTRTYKDLRSLYDKFYKDGVKIVPKSLVLTPVLVRQWYLGDGDLSKGKNVRIATHSFSTEDVDYLIENFDKLGIKVTKQKELKQKEDSGYRLFITVESSRKFFEYIGDCPKELKDVYGYKWPIKNKRM